MTRNGTAHNRIVYAPPPFGGSGLRFFARSVASLVPTQKLRHIGFASVRLTQRRIQPERYAK